YFTISHTLRSLHSFPTRRSSDLALLLQHVAERADRPAAPVGVDGQEVDPLDAELVHVLLEAERLHLRRRADPEDPRVAALGDRRDRKSTRLNSSHVSISYAVFCL